MTALRQPAPIDDMPGINAALVEANRCHREFVDTWDSETWTAFRAALGDYRDHWQTALDGKPVTPGFEQLRRGVDLLAEVLAAMDALADTAEIPRILDLVSDALDELGSGLARRDAVNEAYIDAAEADIRALAGKRTSRRTIPSAERDDAADATAGPTADPTAVLRLFPDVATALMAHGNAPTDVSWFRVRTAVDRLDTAVQALAATTSALGLGDTVRAGADLLGEAVAAMNAAGGHRLSPGAEIAVSAALERAGTVLAEGLTALTGDTPSTDLRDGRQESSARPRQRPPRSSRNRRPHRHR